MHEYETNDEYVGLTIRTKNPYVKVWCEIYKIHVRLVKLNDIENPSKIIDFSVSYDGSWHRGDFTSKYGVGCCIEVKIGLLINYEVLYKF